MNMVTSTCFRVEACEAEIALLEQAMSCFDAACAGWLAPSYLVDAKLPDPKGGTSRMSGLRSAMKGNIGIPLGLNLTKEPTGAIISGEGRLNLSAMAELLRILLPSSLPVRIHWSSRTDPMTPGSFLGGWIVVQQDDVVEGDTHDAATAEMAKAARRTEPTEVQRRAARAYAEYDDEHLSRALDEEKGPIEDFLRSQRHGDTLSAFIYIETGDAGDDHQEAARMMRSAATQLEHVADALEN